MNIIKTLCSEFNLKSEYVENTITLLEEGNSVPFIARYRKELTGSMSDEILRDFTDRLDYLQKLEKKREQVLRLIDEQGKLTEKLKTEIENAETNVLLDDIYRPFRPRKRTLAGVAKEKGLEPLAIKIMNQNKNEELNEIAKDFVNLEKGVETIEDALKMAADIISEDFSSNPIFRATVREDLFENGLISVEGKGTKDSSVFKMYYDYEDKVKKIPGYRILAINRGENLKELQVSVKPADDRAKDSILNLIFFTRKYYREFISEIFEDSYKKKILPAVSKEIRNALTEKAEEGAMEIFSQNLKQVLMQAPITGKRVLAIDPAFKTGCKIAALDENGNPLAVDIIYPVPPRVKLKQSNDTVYKLIKKFNIDIIAIGNGTASRETEQFVSNFIKKYNKDFDNRVSYLIVNEAGASVYSASKLATKEFPKLDVSLRSAISIGRRLQDPLSELVKIDAKSIGVGQYQHDVNQKNLSKVLDGVVESCVNTVSVELNSASISLLSYVSGISSGIAKSIIEYREKNGAFKNRQELLNVPRLGARTFEQAAGFLRIRNSTEALDNTSVHPESYDVAKLILKEAGIEIASGGDFKEKLMKLPPIKELARKLNVGEITLKDIILELEKPGRTPRDNMNKPLLKTDVLEFKDLYIGLVLQGTVRNIVDFGAFVDIGIHQDALIHISNLSDKFVKHPLDIVSVGDLVELEIIKLDDKRERTGVKLLRKI